MPDCGENHEPGKDKEMPGFPSFYASLMSL